MKKIYEVSAAGEVAGRWHTAGERIEMTEAEAKYLAPPLGTILIPVVEKRKSDHGKLDGRQRKRRHRAHRLVARPAVDNDDPDHADR